MTVGENRAPPPAPRLRRALALITGEQSRPGACTGKALPGLLTAIPKPLSYGSALKAGGALISHGGTLWVSILLFPKGTMQGWRSWSQGWHCRGRGAVRGHEAGVPASGTGLCCLPRWLCCRAHRRAHTGMMGARLSVARGGSKSFAKSWGCCNARASFAPTFVKVSGAEASELGTRCRLPLMYLFVQVCFCEKERKPTPSPGPLCSLHWGSSLIAGPGGCNSAGFSSMRGSRLVALIFLGDEEGAGASHALLTTWGPGLAVQDVAHGSSPGWQELPVPARCLNRGEKKTSQTPHPWAGASLRQRASTCPPPSIAGKLWGLKCPPQAGLVPDRVAKGRVGSEGSGKGWDPSICPREEEAVGIGAVPAGLCTGQLPRPLRSS